MEEYYCPNCGTTLNDQYGFDPKEGHWTCEICGTELYDESLEETMDRFDGVVWYCDNCGACLNKQTGFNDYSDHWYCTECGYENPINENEIYESHEEYEKTSYWRDDYSEEDEEDSGDSSEEYSYASYEEDESDDGYDSDEYYSSSEELPPEGDIIAPIWGSSIPREMPEFPFGQKTINKTQNNTHIYESPKNQYDVEIEKMRDRRAHKRSIAIIALIGLLAVLLFLLIVFLIHTDSKNRQLQVDTYQTFSETVQQYIDEERFGEAERLVLQTNPDKNWPSEKRDSWLTDKENLLVEIEEKKAISTGVPIKTIAVPRDSSSYKRINYMDAVTELTDLGFLRVHFAPSGDKANLVHKANTVQRVSIDGETDFEEGDQYSKTVKIMVYYYTEDSN